MSRLASRLSRIAVLVCLPGIAAACGGGLDRSVRRDIRHSVHARQPALQRCYAKALARDSATDGEMTIRFEVVDTGAVRRVEVAGSTVDDPRLERCVVGEFRKVSLPRPAEARVSVTYPLEFESE